MESKIKVGVRIRPLNAKELEASSSAIVESDSSKFVLTKSPAKKSCFEYDWSFGSKSTNRDIYENSCKPLIENIYEGFNATFFAYGQTSSGKTHTLGGADMSEGVIPSALQDIFQRRQELISHGSKVDIELSYIEIYREECFDLLSKDGQKVRLDLKETSNGRTVLDGVAVLPVQNVDEVMDLLREGAKIRSTGQTAMNAHSSRSHSICTLTLRIVRATSGAVTSQLHLVDLAGSERAKKTQATGDAFQEGISINRGLLALGNVVSALAARSLRVGSGGEAGHTHVPYRESKLTRLLKDALGGNGMTVMLACVSPAECNVEETLNTLRFASRASAIVNSARVNHSVGEGADSAALLRQVLELREQVALLQSQSAARSAKSLVSTKPSREQLEEAVAQRTAYAFMVRSALRITLSLKSVLVTCLQEGSYVVDSDLLHIQGELQEVRKGLGLPAQPSKALVSAPSSSGSTAPAPAECGDVLGDLDMAAMLQLPPIMTVLEEVRLLERDLRAVERSYSTAGGERGRTENSAPSDKVKAEKGSEECWGTNDSMLSGGSLELSLLESADAEADSGPCTVDSNQSFDHSFDGLLAQDCDALQGEGAEDREGCGASFDVDCSFSEVDAARMGDLLAEYMATQGQSTRTVPGSSGADAKPAAMTKVEEEMARQAAQGLAAKEAEMGRISALTDKYQVSIKTLKAEIAAIEGEQSRLQARQAQQQQQVKRPLAPATKVPGAPTTSSSSTSAAASAEELRIKQQLKEKTRLLEEKIKLLRSKESEFGKVNTQKVKLASEVETMKKVVEENKRKRADLQRRMREEAVVHRNEKVQIKHAEVQARRGELQAQQSLVRLEGQLQTKEKVWKAQLESKEREKKALQELVTKQANAKSFGKPGSGAASGGPGAAAGHSAHLLAAAGALMTQQGSSGLTTQEVRDLKLWVDAELEAQVKRVQTQEALTREMLLRTKAAQALQAARRSSHGGNNGAGGADTSMTMTAPAEVKALEQELRQRSATIASLNNVLSDLGHASAAEKQRFSRFTDLKQTRHVGELLFEVAYKAQKRELSAARRLKSLQDALQRTKQQLMEAQSSAEYYQQLAEQRKENYIFDDEESERAEMDETFYPSEDESAFVSDASDSEDSYRGSRARKGRAGAGGTKATAPRKRKAGSTESSVDTEPAEEGEVEGETGNKIKKVRVQVQQPKKGKRGAAGVRSLGSSGSSAGEVEGEAGSDSGSSAGDSASDASSSDDDSEAPRRPKKRAPRAAGTAEEGGAVKKAKRVASVDPTFDDSEITFPLTKHTIAELKRFLAAKGLPVSGVKAELIKRLQAVLPSPEAVEASSSEPAPLAPAVDAVEVVEQVADENNPVAINTYSGDVVIAEGKDTKQLAVAQGTETEADHLLDLESEEVQVLEV